jgi:hypothetical protein
MHGDTGGLEVCGGCGARLVEVEAWKQLAADHWWFRLVCMDCRWCQDVVAERPAVERFESAMEAVRADITCAADAWRRSQMRDWAASFRAALDAEAVLPMDFRT